MQFLSFCLCLIKLLTSLVMWGFRPQSPTILLSYCYSSLYILASFSIDLNHTIIDLNTSVQFLTSVMISFNCFHFKMLNTFYLFKDKWWTNLTWSSPYLKTRPCCPASNRKNHISLRKETKIWPADRVCYLFHSAGLICAWLRPQTLGIWITYGR